MCGFLFVSSFLSFDSFADTCYSIAQSLGSPSTKGTDYGYMNSAGTFGSYFSYSNGANGAETTMEDWGFVSGDKNAWATKFSYGTVSGLASCNSVSGAYADVATPDVSENFGPNTTGKYCWCHVTGFIPDGATDKITFDFPWALGTAAYTSATQCGNNCGRACGNLAMTGKQLRESMWACDAGFHVQDNMSLANCASTKGTDYGFINGAGTFGNKYTYENKGENTTLDYWNFTEYDKNVWATDFSFGRVSGFASCNDTSGTYGFAADEQDAVGFGPNTVGPYCWCKLTEFEPANTNTKTYLNSDWILGTVSYTTTQCRNNCARLCANFVSNNSTTSTTTMRRSLFESVGTTVSCGANVVNLVWNANGIEILRNTCTYGYSEISLPEPPEAPVGYKFNGWRISTD